MKLVITESQLKKITEQGVLDRIKTGAQNLYKDFEKSVESNPMLKNSVPSSSPAGVSAQGVLNMDPHTINNVLQFMVGLAPGVGPLLVAGIGAVDAYQYHKEGKDKQAVISAVLSSIPLLGQLATQPWVKNLTKDVINSLSNKILQGATQYTQAEANVINGINLNRDPVIQAVKQAVSKVKSTQLGNVALKNGLQYGRNKAAQNLTDLSYDALTKK